MQEVAKIVYCGLPTSFNFQIRSTHGTRLLLMELNHDKEILEFFNLILHDVSHLVRDLEFELEHAKRDLKFEKASDQIAKAEEVTQELYQWVKRMQFLISTDTLIPCDFLRDVLEPFVLWNWHGKLIHVAKASSARNAPAILIRPRLAAWGLIQIYDLLSPAIHCSGEQRNDQFTFFIRVERKLIPKGLLSVDKACELLTASGADVQISPARTEFAITLDLARTQSP